MKKILALPGVFLPHNETITLIVYKHLRNLNAYIDVLTYSAEADESLIKQLEKDEKYKKFNINTINFDWKDLFIKKGNKNVVKIFSNFFRYRKEALKMIRKKDYDIIYSSSVPSYTHYPAYLIKKKHKDRIKWIASFSDPIKDNLYVEEANKRYEELSIKGKIAFHIENYIHNNPRYQELTFQHANLLIFPNEELRDYMIGDSKTLLEKSLIIPFNYIEEWDIYKNLMSNTKFLDNEIVKFVHFGNIYGLRKVEKVLLALKEIKEEKNKKDFVFVQYGPVEPYVLELVKEYELEDVFEIKEKISYEDCMNKMNEEADVLVIFDTILGEDELQPWVPSKILEYILTRKPIFSVTTKRSAVFRMLKDNNICVNYDVSSIKQGIIEQLENISLREYDFEQLENKKVINETLIKYIEKW